MASSSSSSFLYKRQQQPQQTNLTPISPKSSSSITQPRSIIITFFNTPTCLIILISSLLIFGLFLNPWMNSGGPLIPNGFFFSNRSSSSKWKDYTFNEAVRFVGNGSDRTVIMCAVSSPYLPFLSNWLISISRFKHQEKVLVIAEDYKTLFLVNERWPGHAVLVPPVPDEQTAHKFGSQGFFNFTARRPRHLLHILELGYNVMYNDVDMVWLADPFTHIEGNHDIYFTDDMTAIKPLEHSHALPPPGKKGRPYICSCMIFLRPTPGAKLVMKKWIEELQDQPWSRKAKANDQPGFNWALQKTAQQVDMYLLPQAAFPTGGLYFKNKTWVKETKGKHAIIHNNYIIGFEKKIQRFRDFGLWLVDEHSDESPLGKL